MWRENLMKNIKHPYGNFRSSILKSFKNFLQKIIKFFVNFFYGLDNNDEIIISSATYIAHGLKIKTFLIFLKK